MVFVCCRVEKPIMTTDAKRYVPRPVEDPQPEKVLAAMTPQEPYVVSDLLAEFNEEETNKTTIRNRLEHLVDEGDVRRKKHSNRTVTYRRLY